MDINAVQDKWGQTPLFEAMNGKNRLKESSMILRSPYVDRNIKDKSGKSLLFYAVQRDFDGLNELLCPKNNGIPFINDLNEQTIKSKNYNIGINPLLPNNDGKIVFDEFEISSEPAKNLQILKCYGGDEAYPPLHASVVEERLDIVSKLLELGI